MVGVNSLFQKLISLATHLCSDWPVVMNKLVGIAGIFISTADTVEHIRHISITISKAISLTKFSISEVIVFFLF